MNKKEHWEKAESWLAMAEDLLEAGEARAADDAMLKGVSHLAAIGECLMEGNAWLRLGRVRLERGEPALALNAFERSNRCFERGEFTSALARVALAHGEALLYGGEALSAIQRLESASLTFAAEGRHVQQAVALCLLGEVLGSQGESGRARECLEQARLLAEHAGSCAVEARAWFAMGHIELAGGGPSEALRAAEASSELSQSIGDSEGRAWGMLLEADASSERGRPFHAWRYWRGASRLFRQSGCKEGQLEAVQRRVLWPLWRVLWLEITRVFGGKAKQLSAQTTEGETYRRKF